MRKNKLVALGLSVALATSAFSGCGISTDTPIIGSIVGLEDDQVFQVDKIICSVNEYKVEYLKQQKSLIKNMDGSVDWTKEVSAGITLEDYVKNKTKEAITAKYTLAAMANDCAIVLTDAEAKQAEDEAKTYYDSLKPAEQEYLGSSLADVKKYYKMQSLANKVYTSYTANIGNDVSDEEARVVKIQYIRMNTATTKVKRIKQVYKEITDLVNGGYRTFIREAKQFSEDSSLEVLVKKNQASKTYETKAFEMSNKDISPVIQEGNDYYLVYCVNSYDKKETAKNKAAIIAGMKKAAFDEKYNEYLDKADTDFNTAAWKGIELLK